MDHHEMVLLIRAGVTAPGGTWADLGAGSGNFTWALAELLGPQASIYAFDRDARAIAAQQTRLLQQPPAATILPRQADVTRPLVVPPLDGILLANLLHFMAEQATFLRHLRTYLQPAARFLIVEYEQEQPLLWVPHPLPWKRLEMLTEHSGLTPPRLVGKRQSPSSGRVLYAAVTQALPE